MQTPPAGALTCPSSEVPVPNAITGTRCRAQIRTTSWMSAVSCAITTASGGCGASHVVVWACWSRTACDVTSRLPKRAASASMVVASACGSGRGSFCSMDGATCFLPARRPWQRNYGGSRDEMRTSGGPYMSAVSAEQDDSQPASFRSSIMQIEPQWIDYNGHLNMAYYNVM